MSQLSGKELGDESEPVGDVINPVVIREHERFASLDEVADIDDEVGRCTPPEEGSLE
jgi:hypothetical protein